MHLNFDFNAVQVLWTLTFAALMVLLVVLLGRDRMRRFPWFTASIALVALRLLSTRLLFGRLPPLTMSSMFIVMADAAAIVGFLVLVELARHAFGTVSRRTWNVYTAILMVLAALVPAFWGVWPAWKTLTANSALAALRLMQLFAQKGDLLVSGLTVELGLLVVFLGRKYKAGWRSHTQQVIIGLSTAALAQLAMQAIWQLIALKAVPHSEAEYEQIRGLRDKLFNANGVIYIAVLVWWIVYLWIDEPGNKADTATPTGPLPVKTTFGSTSSSPVEELPPPAE